MSLAETIAKYGGKSAIGAIAKRFGLSDAMASKAVAMLLPALAGGLSRNLGKEGGLGSLLGALTGGSHEKYLDQSDSLADDATAEDGNGILGHVLGGKDASRAVAATVAGALGIEGSTVKSMLPMVAAMTMGGLAKQTKSAGLTAEATEAEAAQSSGDVLGQLAGMLDVGGAGDLLGKLL